MSKYLCKKCCRHQSMCICDLSSYTNIGDISAVEFVTNHLSYELDAGSPIYQGWAYKHTQMKFKLNELEDKFKEHREKLIAKNEKLEQENKLLKARCERLYARLKIRVDEHIETRKENRVIQKKLDIAVKGLNYIANNSATMDDMSYCVYAENVIANIDK